MDKNYKIVIKDFSRTPILSDDVFKAMDKNNDGEVSKVPICILMSVRCLPVSASEKR